MAPKPAQKPKAKAETLPPAPKPKKAGTPKKKEPVILSSVAKDPGSSLPVDVSFEGHAATSKARTTGGYTHTLKLDAPASFTIVKTFVMEDGPYAGMQAVLIRPAKSFPFLKLPEEVRARIYRFYFAPKGLVNDSIILEGKRSTNKEVYAKTYADGSKNRVALLAVNHEINDKALPIFYAHNLKFENTTTLLDFLGQVKEIRPHLTSVDVKAYVKNTARPALSILAESPRINRLHFESSVCSEDDAVKAAKQFHEHAYKFLEAVGAVKGDPEAGVEVLSFAKGAFKFKDEKKNEKSWSPQLVEEFKECLREKMNALAAAALPRA